ncbi:N-acyl-D-amino-acid deacylase [Actinopolymorpha cephalotaxi]|uniref:N-acyl-D-amino-acid deacylase n=1 Tax=Actinopolymorpha cephalotaxi TaxID=504797 RepID=A0A1I2WXL2_9ACTN|nr:amidohydrolase family protein [Actinopolymorpha cephalotaxi]NYH85157.1 N-acyl-D-amino-acid deacylase [Actinopolymorpha cephalotaxi]SFH05467.1 N-acyl-D-amino-acid deacylase [Actinopolymorpha cephalotaxi]
MLDLLVSGGTVVEGDGGPPYPADVAIEGERIVAVEPLPGATARRHLDARGHFVLPGLIDPHSHSDWSILGNPEAQSTIRQGVTTEVVGNCGVTYAPLGPESARQAAATLAAFGYDGPVDWRGFGELLQRVESIGTSQNLAWFVGHSALREAAGVGTGSPGDDELATMRALLAEALDAGALGMSSGLEYGAGRAAGTGELTDLAGVLRLHGARYASHIRNRDAALDEAVEEFFTVTRAAGGRAQLSHLNVREDTGAAPDAWQRAVERLAAERAAGTDVLADMTPYDGGIGMATGLLPPWLLADGPEEAARQLADPAVRNRLRGDCDRYWRFVHRGGWDRVRLQAGPATPELEGLAFPEIAERLGGDEWDAFFDVLAAAGPDLAAVQLLGRLFTDEHVAETVSHPLFCLGVDAFTSRVDGPLAARSRHPLFFAGHVHYLAHHVRDKGILTLETAVHKMTAMVADHFGLAGRGRLRRGAFADVAVVDLAGLRERSTVAEPHAYAHGVPYVIVNGAVVVDGHDHTGVRTGCYLPRGR